MSFIYRCPGAYKDLRQSGYLVLPSQRILAYHKNKVNQGIGINNENLNWMLEEAKRRNLGIENHTGGLVFDEMAVKKDLQVIKKGSKWELAGCVDIGELCNNIDIISAKKKEVVLANQCLQFIFLGFGGFRWPVAYFATNSAKPCQIYANFWKLVRILKEYSFNITFAILDGSINNRTFTNMMFKFDPKLECYTTRNPYNHKDFISIIQDPKHLLKKIRNSIFLSTLDPNGKRCFILDGEPIIWDHFVKAFEFNKSCTLRLYRKLTKEHIFLTDSGKMRNHLCEETMNSDMLNLMRKFSQENGNNESLTSTIKLLEKTSVLVEMFSNTNSCVYNEYDNRLNVLRDILEFFRNWENQFSDKKDIH